MKSMELFKNFLCILPDPDADPALFFSRTNLLGLPFLEKVLAPSSRFTQYCRNKKLILTKTKLQNYNDVSKLNQVQVLLSLQLKGPCWNRNIVEQEIEQKYNIPSIAKHVHIGVREGQTCAQEKRIDNSQSTPELISVLEWEFELESTKLLLQQSTYFCYTILPIPYPVTQLSTLQ